MAPRIPRTIRLPFGFHVQVVRVTRAEMREAIDLEEDDAVPDGCWVGDDMTIYLIRGLRVARQRYVLCHELEHAATDLTHQVLNDGVGRP